MDEKFFQEEEPKEGKNSPFPTKADSNKLSRKNTFSKKEHLKSERQIRSLFESGKKINEFPLILYWNLIGISAGESQLVAGFSVPTKYFKRAVDRNRIKRQMRESFRLNKNAIYSQIPANKGITLMLIYNSPGKITYEKLNKKLLSCLKRLLRSIDERSEKSH